MADENVFKKHCEASPNFVHYLRNAYEAYKVLKASTNKGGDVLKNQRDVGAKAEVINELYWGKRDAAHRLKIANFLIDIKFPQVFTDILSQLKLRCPDYLTYDREKSAKTIDLKLKKDTDDVIKKAQDIVISLASAMRGYTENNDDYCISSGGTGIVPLLAAMIEKLKDSTSDMLKDVDSRTQTLVRKTPRGLMLARSMDILHNISRRSSCRKHFANCKIITSILLPITKDEIADFASKALLTLAYIVDEENNDTIMANAEPIKLLIYLLTKAVGKPDRRHLGFTPMQLANGLAQIGVNDSNKKLIGEHGAIPVLINMITTAKDDEERESACLALWNLAFDVDNKKIITKLSGALETIKKQTQSKNQKVRSAACGAIWEIEGKQAYATKYAVEHVDIEETGGEAEEKSGKQEDKHKAESTKSSVAKQVENHVMISYQWDVQGTLIKVKNRLQAAGYKIWMDLEQMGGSTLESMANAVENSSVILMCVSQKYKESANCRSEAEYAFQLRKEIVPLIMDANYRADGWLGIILGSKLWIDFSDKKNFNDSVEKLKKEINNRTKGLAIAQAKQNESVCGGKATPMPDQPDISNWSADEVVKWLNKLGLSLNPKVMQRLTGRILLQLADLRNESPEFFYNTLKLDLGLTNIFDVLKFSEELKELTS